MAKEQLKLTKKNFFDMIKKESPLAMQKFTDEVDNFKEKINWKELFSPNGVDDKGELTTPKFHEITYAFQRGYISLFFAGMDIMVYVNPADAKIKGYSWMVIDTVAGHMAKSFLDATQTDETVFQSFIQCEIDAFKSAFLLLNERLDVSETTEEDQAPLN